MAEQTEEQKPPAPHHQAHGDTILHRIRRHPLFIDALLVMLAISMAAGYYIWQDMQSKIYIEKAEIRAPVISIGPTAPGILDKLYVQEGDMVSQGQRLALVGDETITAKTQGVVIGVSNVPGELVSPQTSVVTMIDRRQLRLVGSVQEDKGLKDIAPGQKVVFTVDAYPGRQYNGTVESIAESAKQADIVFSISDQRQERDFEVTAVFDVEAYQELKNGMSAKMWVYR
jgi:multidrug resistance efflux pump